MPSLKSHTGNQAQEESAKEILLKEDQSEFQYNNKQEKQQKSKSTPPKEKEVVHLNHIKTCNESPKEKENKQTQTIQESPRKKPFVSHYDPDCYYLYEASNKPAKPVHDQTKNPIKLTVTLKDIGLEGLDSPIPGKAAEMRQREKMENEIIEQPRAKSNRRQRKSIAQPSSQSPLSHSSRRIRFDLAD